MLGQLEIKLIFGFYQFARVIDKISNSLCCYKD